jgi:hypothetical protein
MRLVHQAFRNISFLVTGVALGFTLTTLVHAEIGNRAVSGRTVIKIDNLGNIVIAVGEPKGGLLLDGVIDHIFVFTPTDAPSSLANTLLKLEHANVVYEDGRLVVSSPTEGVILDLSVGADTESEKQQSEEQKNQLERSPSRNPAAVKLHGIGIAYYPGPFSPGQEELVSNARDGLFSVTADPGSDCTSGGCGATQCSITCPGGNCSVTCGPAFFACCLCGGGSVPSCRCRLKQGCPNLSF